MPGAKRKPGCLLLNLTLAEAGLGHISEIFEGDAPHRPGGCIGQAWSVSEILRAHYEDVKNLGPNHDQEAAQPRRRTG